MNPPAAEASRSRRDRIGLHLTAAVVTALILAPLVRPGYVLRYDMVFVPHQALLWDLIAPTGELPRAVPEDAVVSLLNTVLPGWLLQRIALVGIVYAATLGAGRLVPARRLLTRLVAAVGYGWTPFLAERLLLGQWGLLLAYAALPWLVAGALRVRSGQPGGLPRLLIAAAVCAITPTGGAVALATTVALAVPWPPSRRPTTPRSPAPPDPSATGAPYSTKKANRVPLHSLIGVVVLNLPWLVAGFATAATGRTDPAGVSAFAARGENWAGPIVALLGTGGVWNAQTTPTSRASVIVPVVTVVLLALAAIGVGPLRRRWPDGAGTAVLVLAALGFVAGLLGVLPGTTALLEWAVRTIPGAGLLRDGQKFLLPYVLVLALTVALGVERLAARFAPERARLVLAALVLLPVVALPDLAIGALGQLGPVHYPDDWDRVAAAVAQAPGPVLSLPFNEYRAFAWNDRRTVLDPATRYLAAPVLTDDDLIVGSRLITGENPQAAQVRALLAAGEPVTRTGVRWVLVARDAGGSIPAGALAGLQPIYTGTSIDLYANPQASPPTPPDRARRWLLGISDLLAALVFIGAIGCLCGMTTPW